MKKYMDRVLLGSLILLLPVSGFACSTAEWDSTSGLGTTIFVAGPTTPFAPPQTAPLTRVSEFCAMRATDTGHVQDNSPSAHTKFIARFYVRPQLSGSGQVDLFLAYDNDTPGAHLFKVSYDGANLDFHAAGTTVVGTAPAAVNAWHLVEIEYNADGTSKFWVNANAAATPTPAAPTGTFSTVASSGVQSVRLGLPNGRAGYTGSASFDGYESHSTTAVGSLLIGDANGIGGITTGDYAAVQRDILGTLQAGQPDCNLSGEVTTGDYRCIQQKILGN
jgi:hypothetical protein